MQTTVNVKQAFGIAGEIYDLTPYRVDSRIVAAPATFGKPAGISATGTYANMASTTYTTFVGIFVRPKEDVSYGTSDGGPLAPTMTVPAGKQVQIMSMGRVIVDKPTTEAWAENANIYVTAAGAFTTTSSNNTLIGKVVVGGVQADKLAVIQLG